MKSPGLVLVALACAGFLSVGCTHGLNPTVGQITPEHFEFTTVYQPNDGKRPGTGQ